MMHKDQKRAWRMSWIFESARGTPEAPTSNRSEAEPLSSSRSVRKEKSHSLSELGLARAARCAARNAAMLSSVVAVSAPGVRMRAVQ